MGKISVRRIMAVSTVLALTGCTVYETPGRAVVVHDRDGYRGGYYDNDRDHCPPGHRKKHWC